MESKPKHSNALVLSQGVLILLGGMSLLGMLMMLAGHYDPELHDSFPPGSNRPMFVFYCVESIIAACAAAYYAYCSHRNCQPRAVVFHIAAAAQIAMWLSLNALVRSMLP
jgi:hypothetical protein